MKDKVLGLFLRQLITLRERIGLGAMVSHREMIFGLPCWLATGQTMRQIREFEEFNAD